MPVRKLRIFKHGVIGKFSDNEIFQHSGKRRPLFTIGLKNCLQDDYNNGPHIISF
jgi:hypothetical protein